MIFACLTSSLEKCCYPSWSRAGCTVLSQFSAQRGPLCECVCCESTCVCISPWKVFPHARDPTSLWQRRTDCRRRRRRRRNGRGMWSPLQHASVIKCRRCRGRAEGLGVSWAGRGGARLSKPSSFHPLSFGEVKRDTCFSKVRVMVHTVFLALKEELHNEL